MADIVDADELKSKKKRPGLFYSILTTFSKVGAAIAVGLVYTYLEFKGFKPDQIASEKIKEILLFVFAFIPMILLLISYWVFAMPIGYYLTNYGFGDPLGAKGMWFGMILGLTIFSFLSIFRLRWVMKSNIKRISVEEPLPL